ncbi:MAG: D-2-hydroxyacid dehydrogenase [Thermomicrobiales bacterium]|nr:D-2-hydroxyacid dehydrogenase [Thermomicrobiales bacterium]
MKLLIQSIEGEEYFGELNDIEGLTVVVAMTQEEAEREVADADIMYGWPTASMIAAASKLKWVQFPSAGADRLLKVPELVEADILVTNTRGAHAPSIAEHVFGLLLSMTRAIPPSVGWQKEHVWNRVDGYRLPREIMGMTMGIVGYGHIGRAVAKRAAGFDMRILAVDVAEGPGDAWVDQVWPVSKLPDMLAASDVVVIAAPYTRETHHMIDSAAFAAMKGDAYLVAISRGGVVDEDALLATLKQGKLAGVGLDVAEVEPLDTASALWNFSNVLITPHLAGSSWQKERRCFDILVENIGRYRRGEELRNLVNKQAGY